MNTRLLSGRNSHSITWTLLSFLASGLVLIACGDDEEGKGDGITLGDGDLSLGNGDGDGGGLPSSQDGGRAELTAEQVEGILSAECTGWSGEGESLPATLELVIDVSGSMNQPPPGRDNRGQSKWEITRDALDAAVASLPPTVSLGALYYPNQVVSSNSSSDPGPVSDCVNVSGVLPMGQLGTDGSPQRTVFASSLDSVSVDSYTPTHDAYTYALEEQLIPYQGPNKFILLITDGAPTIDQGCSWPVEPAVIGPTQNGDGAHDGDTDPIVQDVERALEDHGVRTFIIGAPGSEQSVESGTDKRPWLSEAAMAGGTAAPNCSVNGPNYCHFDMAQSTDFAAELTAGLAAIAGQIVDECVFNVPDNPRGDSIDPTLTQVIIEWGDGEKSLIFGDGNGDCEDGWTFDSGKQAIELCEQTCDQVRVDNRARVHVSFGCSQDEVDMVVR